MEFVKKPYCYSLIQKVAIKADLPQRHKGTLSHHGCSEKSCQLVLLKETADTTQRTVEDCVSLNSYYCSYPHTIHSMQWLRGTGELLNYRQKWTASKLLPAVFALEPSLSSLSLDSSRWINGIQYIPSFIYTEPSHGQLLWFDITVQ